MLELGLRLVKRWSYSDLGAIMARVIHAVLL
jgi:hypothetical protein